MHHEVSFFSLIVVIGIISSLAALMCQMMKKERLMYERLGQRCDVFQNEKTKLLSVTIVFIVSYLLDFAYYYEGINQPHNYVLIHCGFQQADPTCSNRGPLML